jgi:hypothetical protein
LDTLVHLRCMHSPLLVNNCEHLQNDKVVGPNLSTPANSPIPNFGSNTCNTLETEKLHVLMLLILCLQYEHQIASINEQRHTPPGLRAFAITSRYSTILWAVSIKKQDTTASQASATDMHNQDMHIT